MRPWLSVTGTRCTRCVPPSNFRWLHAVSPLTTSVTWLKPPRSLASLRQHLDLPALRDRRSRWYISNRSRANRLASSPPSAPRISMITALPSLGSFGSISVRIWSSSSATSASASTSSARHSSRSSPRRRRSPTRGGLERRPVGRGGGAAPRPLGSCPCSASTRRAVGRIVPAARGRRGWSPARRTRLRWPPAVRSPTSQATALTPTGRRMGIGTSAARRCWTSMRIALRARRRCTPSRRMGSQRIALRTAPRRGRRRAAHHQRVVGAALYATQGTSSLSWHGAAAAARRPVRAADRAPGRPSSRCRSAGWRRAAATGAVRAGRAMGRDERDHVGQRLDGGTIAVQHLEGLAVVRADTDLEPDVRRCRLVDHAAHLEAGTSPASTPCSTTGTAPPATISARTARARRHPAATGSGSATASSSVRPSRCDTRIGRRTPAARRASTPVPASAMRCTASTHRGAAPTPAPRRGCVRAVRRASTQPTPWSSAAAAAERRRPCERRDRPDRSTSAASLHRQQRRARAGSITDIDARSAPADADRRIGAPATAQPVK